MLRSLNGLIHYKHFSASRFSALADSLFAEPDYLTTRKRGLLERKVIGKKTVTENKEPKGSRTVKHYHRRLLKTDNPNVKTSMSHTHAGGGQSHQHKNMAGYSLSPLGDGSRFKKPGPSD